MRRINARTLGLAVVAIALGAAAVGCQDAGSQNPSTTSCGGKIAIFGAFTGDNAGLVIPSLNAAKLAVKQHNTAKPDCKIEMTEFDTQGDPAQATPAANQIASDQSYIGVIGGHFSGETDATMPIFEAAGMAMIAPSATRVDLTQKGNKAMHRVVGHDGTQAAAAGAYIKEQGLTKVFLVDDGSAYGSGITAELTKVLGSMVAGSDKVQEKQTQFDATITKIKDAGADALFYGGYVREAAPLLKQARAAGVTAKFIGPDGLYDPAFVTGVGSGAEGAIITCPCLPPDKAGGTFSADYQAEYNTPPGSYGAEGYDAAKIFVEAIEAGKTTRADVLAFVNAYDKQGVSKYIKFDEHGDVDPSRVVIWAYEIKGGAIVPLKELKPAS